MAVTETAPPQERTGEPPPKKYLVTVTLRDRYWAIQVFCEAESAGAALEQVAERFNELRTITGMIGVFDVGEAVRL